MKIRDRLQHAWNAFNKKSEDDAVNYQSESFSYGSGVYKNQHRFISHKSIITSLYNRISIDVSSISIKHVRLTEEGQYAGDIKSNLNECLTVSANKDQTYRAFIQDLVLSLFDEGVVAVVPVDMTVDPKLSNSWDVTSMRVGKITQWYPDKVRILVYNEKIGQKQEITMDKKMVAIIENPLYAVMNEPNGTLKRLLRKIELLDDVEEKAASTKLDLIIQLPYQIRSEAKKLQAETRKQEIISQLENSQYGIVYIDATEKVTPLNRPVDNNIMKTIEYLTSMLFSQLGISADLLNGKATEAEKISYYNTTIEPILSAIIDEFNRKFLTKTARSQKQKIQYFNNPFKMLSMADLGNVMDIYLRNTVVAPNEVRSVLGIKPSVDPNADKLSNKNIDVSVNEDPAYAPNEEYEEY